MGLCNALQMLAQIYTTSGEAGTSFAFEADFLPAKDRRVGLIFRSAGKQGSMQISGKDGAARSGCGLLRAELSDRLHARRDTILYW